VSEIFDRPIVVGPGVARFPMKSLRSTCLEIGRKKMTAEEFFINKVPPIRHWLPFLESRTDGRQRYRGEQQGRYESGSALKMIRLSKHRPGKMDVHIDTLFP
jgi:hypothetical protein